MPLSSSARRIAQRPSALHASSAALVCCCCCCFCCALHHAVESATVVHAASSERRTAFSGAGRWAARWSEQHPETTPSVVTAVPAVSRGPQGWKPGNETRGEDGAAHERKANASPQPGRDERRQTAGNARQQQEEGARTICTVTAGPAPPARSIACAARSLSAQTHELKTMCTRKRGAGYIKQGPTNALDVQVVSALVMESDASQKSSQTIVLRRYFDHPPTFASCHQNNA